MYNEVSKKDGVRILVDRVWPRGVSKDQAQLDDKGDRSFPTVKEVV